MIKSFVRATMMVATIVALIYINVITDGGVMMVLEWIADKITSSGSENVKESLDQVSP